ncbi:hypothetical protein RFI_35572, partial [Reticulomyxa filosa]
MKDSNQKTQQMLLFHKSTGLSIEYIEDKNIFKFHKIRVYSPIKSLSLCTYVAVNDCILFFGGFGSLESDTSNGIYKYSMEDSKWMRFEQTLPYLFKDAVAVPSGDNMCVHILGARENEDNALSHMRTKVGKEEGEAKIEQIQLELREMNDDFDFKKLT